LAASEYLAADKSLIDEAVAAETFVRIAGAPDFPETMRRHAASRLEAFAAAAGAVAAERDRARCSQRGSP
jgi:hypothetical protein